MGAQRLCLQIDASAIARRILDFIRWGEFVESEAKATSLD